MTQGYDPCLDRVSSTNRFSKTYLLTNRHQKDPFPTVRSFTIWSVIGGSDWSEEG